MQYYGARDLAESFRTVRKNTIQDAQDIPEDNYGFKATQETRSVAETLVHIAVTPRLQHQVHAVERRSTLQGFDFPAFFERLRAEEREPRSKARILELLQEEGDLWANWVRGLSEGFLAEEVETPMVQPARRNRFEMILSVKEHEMHHRGQLMLMERMIGIVPHLTRQFQDRMSRARKAGA
jgi:uncharacterized damage-inducible protein DinB